MPIHNEDLHRVYEMNAASAGICKDRGGVPTVRSQWDGHHTFLTLERCDFPPTAPQLKGER